jgi:hypothetical protein
VEHPIARERDPFVRQYFSLRSRGKCVNQDAFDFAHRCLESKDSNLSAGLIKAMAIAGCPPDEIAEELGTSRVKVITFEKLFWDIRRYRHQRAWLASIVTPPAAVNPLDGVAVKSAMLMATALSRGAKGVMELLHGTVPTSAHETAALMAQIRGALLVKAHSFALTCLQTPVEPGDLARLIDFSRMPAGEAKGAQETKMDRFRDGIMQLVLQKRGEQLKEPELEALNDVFQPAFEQARDQILALPAPE